MNPSKPSVSRARSGIRWITRTEAADQLKCSVEYLRYLLRKGELQEVTVDKAVGYVKRRSLNGGCYPKHVLDGDEVARYAARSVGEKQNSGRIAAKAWASFEAGKSLPEVVIQLQISPDLALNLLHSYLAAKNLVFLPADVVELLRECGFAAVNKSTFADTLKKLLVLVRAARARDVKAVLEDER